MTGSIQSQALGGLTQTMQFIRHCELVFEWVYYQGRNMVYGLRAQSLKYDWDQGSKERAQGSEEWDQGSQGFWGRIRDQIYYTV